MNPIKYYKYLNGYNIVFGISLVLCFILQAIALNIVGGKTIKSESNYFSSLARIQSGIKDNPTVMFLGSSITGRLPDRKFGFKGCVNLGCDGGSAVDTLTAIDSGIIAPATNIIIEGNTLIRAIEQNESEISKAIKSSWFNLGNHMFMINSTARPAAFLYSSLLKNKIGENTGPGCCNVNITTVPYIPNSNPQIYLSSDYERFAIKISETINRIRTRGVNIFIVMFPPTVARNSISYNIALAVALKSKIPFYDVAAGFDNNVISFTDGQHMTPISSTLIMNVITRDLDFFKK
jgi:hypothetical protein